MELPSHQQKRRWRDRGPTTCVFLQGECFLQIRIYRYRLFLCCIDVLPFGLNHDVLKFEHIRQNR